MVDERPSVAPELRENDRWCKKTDRERERQAQSYTSVKGKLWNGWQLLHRVGEGGALGVVWLSLCGFSRRALRE